MDDADEPARGRSLELAHEPDVASELLVEKLKLLRYERDFLATRRPAWPPVTRHAFLSPSGNGGEQFHRFTSLAAFLARLAGDATHRAPEQFDDPNVACSDIFAALRRLGFETPAFAPGKLRSGRARRSRRRVIRARRRRRRARVPRLVGPPEVRPGPVPGGARHRGRRVRGRGGRGRERERRGRARDGRGERRRRRRRVRRARGAAAARRRPPAPRRRRRRRRSSRRRPRSSPPWTPRSGSWSSSASRRSSG